MTETSRKLTEREWRIVRAELRDRELTHKNKIAMFAGLKTGTDAEERVEELHAIQRKLKDQK